jgi:SAM-dependent methyltransferase
MAEVERFYDTTAQREWERLERFPMEFALTLRALRDYLPAPPARVLDTGGGPGRYAIALARRGYAVTLLDPSRQCLALAATQAAAAEVVLAGCVHGDARDLTRFPEGSFDAVLLLGPLYHLFTDADRRRALREAHRSLRPGGALCAALLTRYALIRWAAKHQPGWLLEHRAAVERLLETGLAVGDRGFSFADLYLAHPTEARPLLEDTGFQVIDLIACEGVVSLIDEQLTALAGAAWEAWVELNYRLGRDPAVHGCADHLLVIACKREDRA